MGSSRREPIDTLVVIAELASEKGKFVDDEGNVVVGSFTNELASKLGVGAPAARTAAQGVIDAYPIALSLVGQRSAAVWTVNIPGANSILEDEGRNPVDIPNQRLGQEPQATSGAGAEQELPSRGSDRKSRRKRSPKGAKSTESSIRNRGDHATLAHMLAIAEEQAQEGDTTPVRVKGMLDNLATLMGIRSMPSRKVARVLATFPDSVWKERRAFVVDLEAARAELAKAEQAIEPAKTVSPSKPPSTQEAEAGDAGDQIDPLGLALANDLLENGQQGLAIRVLGKAIDGKPMSTILQAAGEMYVKGKIFLGTTIHSLAKHTPDETD